MAWARYRHASVSATHPQALGTCDRCGMVYQHNQLAWQHDWRGPRIQNLRILVCPTCMDQPQQNGQRVITIPADPIPIQNPRPDPHMFMGQSSSPWQFQSGAPNTLATEDGAPLLTESVGSEASMLLITEIAEPLTTTAINNFIAVGKTTDVNPSASIMISPNGINWTQVTTAFGNVELFGVAYGNGTWVAVGATIDDVPSSVNAVILSSTDGINWTQRSSPAPVTAGYTLYGVTYGDSKFVAVGWNIDDDTGALLSSSDGITWTVASLVLAHLFAITYSDGLYVVCGSNSSGTAPRIFTSTDAETWTVRSLPVSSLVLKAVAGNGSMFVSVGYDETNNAPLILTSADGITWIQPFYTFNGNIRLTAVTYGDSTWVIVGYNANTPNVDFVVFVSTDDGVNWVSRSDQNSNPGHPLGLAYSGATGSFVSVGGVTVPFIYLSADGQTWAILSSQFVSLGPEIVVNGSFDSSANWNLSAATSVSGGGLNFDGTGVGQATQDNFTDIELADYFYSVTISFTNGAEELQVGVGASLLAIPGSTSTGSFSGIITCGTFDPSLRLRAGAGAVLSMDNFSIKRVLSASPLYNSIYNAVAFGVATGQP